MRVEIAALSAWFDRSIVCDGRKQHRLQCRYGDVFNSIAHTSGMSSRSRCRFHVSLLRVLLGSALWVLVAGAVTRLAVLRLRVVCSIVCNGRMQNRLRVVKVSSSTLFASSIVCDGGSRIVCEGRKQHRMRVERAASSVWFTSCIVCDGRKQHGLRGFAAESAACGES